MLYLFKVYALATFVVFGFSSILMLVMYGYEQARVYSGLLSRPPRDDADCRRPSSRILRDFTKRLARSRSQRPAFHVKP
jgi:hypothetical protein